MGGHTANDRAAFPGQRRRRAPLRGNVMPAKGQQSHTATHTGERKVAGSPKPLHDTPEAFKTKRCTNHNTETN